MRVESQHKAISIINGERMTEEENEETPERLVIEDDSLAAWAMRKYQEAARQRDEVNKVVLAEIEAINEWADKRREKIDRELTHFENLLIEYAEKQRTQFDRKSIDLPRGRVTSRATRESWNVGDSFVKWAKDFAPDLVREKVTSIPETVEVLRDRMEYVNGKVVMKETGEIVEGIEVKTPTIKYQVEANK